MFLFWTNVSLASFSSYVACLLVELGQRGTTVNFSMPTSLECLLLSSGLCIYVTLLFSWFFLMFNFRFKHQINMFYFYDGVVLHEKNKLIWKYMKD